ncbi:Hypothetical predicted protein [Octopus vulgaris]|uniref:FBA domain-containing protein n=1 Tax=Octopus vulgaris TaxID=6645 RepID=A0AA36FCZ1_OCTVU|nr:Hypothetical predicted protein [Octopus vulgaris]
MDIDAEDPLAVDVRTKPLDSPHSTDSLSGDILNIAENFNQPEKKILSTSKVIFPENSKMEFNQMQNSHLIPASSFITNENGELIVDCFSGSNHVMLMSNWKVNGHCGHGLVFKGSDDCEEYTNCPLNVNGCYDKIHGSGCSLIICSALQENTVVSACYLIRSGHKGNTFQKSFIKGEDQWEFSVNSSGQLLVKGCAHSVYSLYHNRENLNNNKKKAKTIFVSNHDGSLHSKLIEFSYCLPHASLIALCSHSCGQQDATSASAYLITLSKGTTQVLLLSESFGEGCIHRSEWKFEVDKVTKFLQVCGPPGPARFALITNIEEETSNLTELQSKDICVVTGGSDEGLFMGCVEIGEDRINGILNRRCDIYISVNSLIVAQIQTEELVATGSNWIFNRQWAENEILLGLNLVQVFANLITDQTQKIELQGSPCQLIKQPVGVVVAINCGGPSYQSLVDNIVYEADGNVLEFDDVSNGNFILRLHCLVVNCGRITVNGENISQKQNSMVHWNAYGDWTIDESGYGTKRAFITSHMRCTKQQEVDLTEFFCVDYLDTSPDIQIMKQFTTGEIGKIYKNNEWQEVSVTFSDYGPGVRGVAIESYGKDDKYRDGHYGTLMSAAMVRVKRESRPAENDVYDDINLSSWLTDGQFQISELDKILAKLLKDNHKLMVDNFVKDIRRETEEEENRNIKWKAMKEKFKFHEVKKQREVRLFVSSTFKDFTKEREELIKKTFQELNQECMDRRIFFSYVDLRWGISQEQNQHEKTIANCLQEMNICLTAQLEIERCRPYFISLMGEKFGWSQREDKPDIVLNESFDYAIEHISDLKWLEECRYGVSVTQVNLPESEWHKERQQSLKNLILSNKDLNSKKYKTTSEVCEFVKKDIIKCLEKDFPQGSELSVLEQRWQAHQAFADVRRRVYVGGETYFKQIDDFMESSQNPIVILGESGCGKSSLLANWCFRLEQKEPDTFFFLHFIGSSPESCSSLKMFHRLYEELKASFGLEVEIPFSDATILQNLTKWLKLVGTRRKCVLVFDALNHLDSALGRGNTGLSACYVLPSAASSIIVVVTAVVGAASAECGSSNNAVVVAIAAVILGCSVGVVAAVANSVVVAVVVNCEHETGAGVVIISG